MMMHLLKCTVTASSFKTFSMISQFNFPAPKAKQNIFMQKLSFFLSKEASILASIFLSSLNFILDSWESFFTTSFAFYKSRAAR